MFEQLQIVTPANWCEEAVYFQSESDKERRRTQEGQRAASVLDENNSEK